MYEFFDHTADLGIHVRAASLEELIEEGARALFSLLVADLETVRPTESVVTRVGGNEPEYLFHDALAALLDQFTEKRLLLRRFQVEPDDEGLTVTAWGETFDSTRHELDHDVKAVTYHQLQAERTTEGWSARVVVDV